MMTQHEFSISELVDRITEYVSSQNPKYRELYPKYLVDSIDENAKIVQKGFDELSQKQIVLICTIIENKYIDVIYDANNPLSNHMSYIVESEREDIEDLHILEILADVLVVTVDHGKFDVWTSHMTKLHDNKKMLAMLAGSAACASMNNNLQKQIERLEMQKIMYDKLQSEYRATHQQLRNR